VSLWFALLFLHGLADRDLWNSHEARAGMDAQTLLDGDWLLPHLYDGRPDLQKPPLYYWLVAALARLRGGTVDAWAVRLPSAVAAILCVVVVAVLGWRCGRSRDGLLAAAILATAIHFTWLARVGRIDMPLTCAVSAALASFYLAARADPDPLRRLGLLLAAYVCLAAAVLLKGPIGIVLPAAAFGAHLLCEGELPPPWQLYRWRKLAHHLGVWWGLPLVAALTVPWFWYADRVTGGELMRVFFWHHNVERGLGGSGLRGHPWWFYAPQFAVDFLPWSLLVPVVVWYFVRGGHWRTDREARFGLTWFLAMTAVLSCARYKRADYLVPAYPGAALFLGCTLRGWYREATSRGGSLLTRVAPISLALVLAGSAIGWWVRVTYVLPEFEARLEHRSFAAVVRRHVPQPEPIVLFRTEAHALAFHLGRPLRILLFWDKLDRITLLKHPDDALPRFVVMPSEVAREWPAALRRIRLVEVANNFDGVAGGHEKPLVLFRMVPCVRTTERETGCESRQTRSLQAGRKVAKVSDRPCATAVSAVAEASPRLRQPWHTEDRPFPPCWAAVRSLPHDGAVESSEDARTPEVAADREGTAQPGAAGAGCRGARAGRRSSVGRLSGQARGGI
jgi:4-amino-4-deoxy-L-arabinose transferase-like glycosyltransferase